MERFQCLSSLDYVKDWNTWRKMLKEGIAEAKKFGVSDETIKSMAVKMGDLGADKVCPQSKEEELLKEMWDIATIDERRTIATLMFKMVK